MGTDTLPGDPKILVVDDDPQLLLLLTSMLARIGPEPDTAETAAEGMEKLQNNKFDLLILDLMLPDKDGFEVLRELREDPRFATLPVIILSALADPDTISRGLELGADGYLTKPYLPNTLTSRVRSILERSR